MEKVVRKGVVEHVISNNLLSKHQHGFRSNRLCLTQLLEYFLEVHEMLEEESVDGADAIYLDCKKAFDTVPHKRLIRKLEAYGVSGKVLRWIKNFLANRSQRVCIKGVFSESLPVVSRIVFLWIILCVIRFVIVVIFIWVRFIFRIFKLI